jgi:RsiW-degrading membrane proteinase PrsW (M82 family)
MLGFLHWFVPALIPAILLAVGLYRSDHRREPIWLVSLTFALGALFGGFAFYIEARAAQWTGLDLRASVSGQAGSLLFLFALIAPMREAAKVAACWTAFRSRHFDEPYDGLVYAGAAALGFAALENAVMLRAHPTGLIWLARAAVAFPAHLFFACAWGYALGRAKQQKIPGPIFPLTWLTATLAHALYTHFVYGRGPGALIAVLPLLFAMGVVILFAARDLRQRGERPSREPDNRLSRMSFDQLSHPPSLRTVRKALGRADQPIMLRWIAFGALVTLGSMVLGLGGSIAFGAWAHVDFSTVDEHEVSTIAPLAILGAGVLAAFPVSGFLVARASNLPSLLESAAASGVAIVAVLVLLGFTAPVALVFALAFSPIAWALACAGAWIGRPLR